MSPAPVAASCSVVCRHDPPEQVERLLLGLTTCRPCLRIYLVDQSRTDALQALARRFGVHYLRQPGDANHARAHNRAVREAAAAGSVYHVVCDAGARMPLGGLARLLGYMEQHPDIGLLAPRVHTPNGHLQPLCKLLPRPFELAMRGLLPLLYRSSGNLARQELHGSGYSRVMDVPALSRCFLLMRIDVVLRAGLFDERLCCLEDVDLSRRVGRIARTVFVPHVTIVRERSRAACREPLLAWRRLVSVLRYFDKWGWLRDVERERINARALRAAGLARGQGDEAKGMRADPRS
jgi:GT2 family glycosyltransferase